MPSQNFVRFISPTLYAYLGNKNRSQKKVRQIVNMGVLQFRREQVLLKDPHFIHPIHSHPGQNKAVIGFLLNMVTDPNSRFMGIGNKTSCINNEVSIDRVTVHNATILYTGRILFLLN